MIDNFEREASDAVEWYWSTRSDQADEQRESPDSTRGRRAEVLGGRQMDGFAGLIEDVLVEAGVPRDDVRHDYHATLPGYYRHEKEWDTAVVHERNLLAVIEYKSIASSFGNNLNNRSEEAIGSFTDLLEAYEAGAFEPSPQPFVGYLMLMADNEESRATPSPREVHFDVDPEFRGASYVDRVEQLCLRMVRKRTVNQSALVLTNEEDGVDSDFWVPRQELALERFVRSLVAHVRGYVSVQQGIDNYGD